jgi:hypothetical protein
MAQYIIEIFLEAPNLAAAEEAREEIVNRICDAADSGELGEDCTASCGDLKEASF